MTVGPLEYLSTWRQRAELLLVMVAIYVFDTLVSDILMGSGVLPDWGIRVVGAFERGGGWAMIVLAAACFVIAGGGFRNVIIPLIAVYLSCAFIHLVVNIAGIFLTAEMHRGQPLTELWDVAVVYFMGVFIFTVWYWFLDKITPGGAFVFPHELRGKSNRTMIDYLFISFNASSTFGPTTETPTTCGAKVLMMLQVCSSLLILMVLLSRAIGG